MLLSEAVRFGTPEDVSNCLETGADPNARDDLGYTALRLAVNSGDVRKIELLMAYGADVNERCNDGNSPICEAISKDRIDIVRRLMAEGVKTDSECDCGTLVGKASLYGNVEIIELLCSMNADVNSYNNDGFTPLMLAAGNGSRNAIPALISHGAELEATDKHNGMTAVLHAAAVGDADAARILIRAGADANAVDRLGRTATQIAAANGQTWIVESSSI